MIKNIHSFKTVGTEGVPVTVETQVCSGIGIHLIGLSDNAVKESLLRCVTALQALGYRCPAKKIVINLAPADLSKSGAGYDLPIALGIIGASEQEALVASDEYVVGGELGLDGSLRDIPGWLQAAELAKRSGMACILPKESAKKAARVMQGEVTIFGVNSLAEAVSICNGHEPDHSALDELEEIEDDNDEIIDSRSHAAWNKVSSYRPVARALEIAAAGGHHMLLVGAPGSNKSDIARAMLEILPPMNHDEAMEVQSMYSAADKSIIPGLRPFRSPDCSCSISAMFGGGGYTILPGEVSLANNGVLYLDEFAELPKSMKEGLRVPMEDGKVVISRLKSKVEYPASFHLVAASNLCPCGYYGDGDRCTCTHAQRTAYLSRLSGPVFDMLTMQVFVHPNAGGLNGEPAAVVAERVMKARELQMKRQGKLNDELNSVDVGNEAIFAPEQREEITAFVENLINHMGISARSYSRILKIARTIADLDCSDVITTSHIAEAASYRFLDRNLQE